MKIILSSIVLLAVVPGLQAQQLASGPHWPASAVGEVPIQHRNVLDQKVSITMKNVGLHTVLDELAQKSGVPVLYSRDVVPVERKVSIQAEGITLQQALQQVLQGTDTEARAASGNRIIIARSSVKTAAEGIIAGKVVNAKTKRPVSGATVVVGPSGRSVTADADGTFRINVSPGERSLTIRAVGFSKQVRTVTVVEGETVRVEIALEQNASVLNEVVVTGTVVATERKAITTPITVITAEEIERRGITRIEDFFRGEIPGVVAIEAGVSRYTANNTNGQSNELGYMQTTDVYSRGASTIGTGATPVPTPNPLKTYVNGVEITDPSYLGTLDPQSIDRIEVVTGPQAATIYGSGALGGVMQIFTKQGNGQKSYELSMRLRYGVLQNNFSSGKTPEHNHAVGLKGGSGPQFSYSADASYNYTGQWQPDLFSKRYGMSIGAVHQKGPITINANVSLTSQSNGTSGYGGINDHSIVQFESRRNGTSEPANGAWYFSQRVHESTSQLLSLNLEFRPFLAWQHRLVIGKTQTQFSLRPVAPARVVPSDSLLQTSEAAGDRTTLGYNMTWAPHPIGVVSPAITLGVNGSFGSRLQVSGCLAGMSAASFESCSGPPGTFGTRLSVTKPVKEESRGVFTSVRMGLLERLYFTFGLRGESNPRYGRKHKIDWTPTSGVAYTVEYRSITAKFMASYGKATRPPADGQRDEVKSSFDARFDPPIYIQQAAAPHLIPERSQGPQGGVEIYFGNIGSISINRYRQIVDELIQNVTIDTVHRIYLSSGEENNRDLKQWQNVGSIKQHGWEGTGSLNIGFINVKGTYSWNDSRVRYSNSRSHPPGLMFVNVPTHTGNISFGYSRGASSAQISTNWIGALTERSLYQWDPNLCIFCLRMPMYHTRGRLYSGTRTKSGYTKSNVVMTHRVSSAMTLTLNIQNVGNSYASDLGPYSPSLGRQTQLGFSWRFSPR